MKERIESLDISKGFAILAVLILHSIAFLPIAAGTSLLLGASMLFFFFVAGYNYNPQRSIKENITNRAKRLLIPFAVYTLLLGTIGGIIFLVKDIYTVPELFSNLFRYITGTEPFSSSEAPTNLFTVILPYWFLLIMFLASTIFYSIANFSLKSWKRMLLVVIALISLTAICAEFVTIRIPWNIQIVPAFTACLLLGAYMGKMNFIPKIQKIKGIKRAGAILGLTILLLVLTILTGSPSKVSNNIWGNYKSLSVYTSFIQGIILFINLILISEVLLKTKIIKKGMLWLGKNSMALYVIHLFMLYIITITTGWKTLTFTRSFATTPEELIKTLLAFVLMLVLSILWVYVEKYIKSKIIKK